MNNFVCSNSVRNMLPFQIFRDTCQEVSNQQQSRNSKVDRVFRQYEECANEADELLREKQRKALDARKKAFKK